MEGAIKMKIKVIFPLSFLFTLLMAKPAFANQPPGPVQSLVEVSILLILIILTNVGGGYIIRNRLEGEKSTARKVLRIFGVLFLLFISIINIAICLFITVAFGIIAIDRGRQMVSWGREADSAQDTPSHLIFANPHRLKLTGTLLVVIPSFLMYMSVAFLAYFPENIEPKVKSLGDFVAHQLAYGRLQELKTGETTFHKLTLDDQEFHENFPGFRRKRPFRTEHLISIDYDGNENGFTVYMWPESMPLFPFNYFTSSPCYRADETGEIKMVRVHNSKAWCPPDAPTVMKVEEKDIERAILIESIKRELINIAVLADDFKMRNNNRIYFSLNEIGWVKPETLETCLCEFSLEVYRGDVYAVVAKADLDEDKAFEIWKYLMEEDSFRRTSED